MTLFALSNRSERVVCFVRLISILFLMVFLRENVLHDIDTNINPMRQLDMRIIIFDLIESQVTRNSLTHWLGLRSSFSPSLPHIFCFASSVRHSILPDVDVSVGTNQEGFIVGIIFHTLISFTIVAFPPKCHHFTKWFFALAGPLFSFVCLFAMQTRN